ncbi:MAG: hypothetical protein HQL37_07860 [Alphaproteobacteria bacterium]|nr:hypothetical protein [Alphaproteobacteria bacterium]
MKKFLGIFAVLAILLGIAAVVIVKFHLVPEGVLPFLDFLRTPKKEETPVVVVKEPAFIAMDTFTIPLIADGKLKGQVVLEVRLEVDQDDKSKISKMVPKLQNAIIKELFDFLPEHTVPGRVPDLEAIKARILLACDKVAGKGGIKSILLQSFYTR